MSEIKQLKFKVTSTEGHSALFVTCKEAKAYINRLYKENRVGAFVEFRIFKVSEK